MLIHGNEGHPQVPLVHLTNPHECTDDSTDDVDLLGQEHDLGQAHVQEMKGKCRDLKTF